MGSQRRLQAPLCDSTPSPENPNYHFKCCSAYAAGPLATFNSSLDYLQEISQMGTKSLCTHLRAKNVG